MDKILGIDLGTTNSCMAFLEGGEATIIPNQEGDRTTPSAVIFTEDGECKVGKFAKRKVIVKPERSALSIKRKMGSKEKIKLNDRELMPREISAMILQKLKNDAEEFIGESINKAVITVPAYFENSQRQATKDAGKIAGLEVKRIVNEPTAAALAYGLDKKDEQIIMVYDLGGGTFDVSLLQIDNGVFKVLATAGNNMLGGDDFDQVIIDYLVQEFEKEQGINLKEDLKGEERLKTLQRLKENSEEGKKELSSVKKTNINIPFITEGPKHLDINITRNKFNQLTEHLVEKTIKPCHQVLEDADISTTELDEVILVGGSTRIPAVQNQVKEITGKDPHKGINPDEVVAIGAALQGGVLSGEVADIVLLDATSLSLGVETKGGKFEKIIERNTTIPTVGSKEFTTAEDNQTVVAIHVLQGERQLARENKTLGHFELSGIPPAPRKEPNIKVTFRVDENNIVHVTAEDTQTARKEEITIENIGALSDAELERMIEEAQKYAEKDQEQVEKIELQNEADDIIYRIEKILDDPQSGLSSTKENKLKKARDELNEIIDKDDIQSLRTLVNEIKNMIITEL